MFIFSPLQLFTVAVIVGSTAAQNDGLTDPEIFITTEIPNVISEITFNPTNLTKTRSGTFRIVHWQTTLHGAHHANITVANAIVSDIVNFTFEFNLVDAEEDSNITGKGTFNASALFVGYNVIILNIYDENDNLLGSAKQQMSVVLSYAKMNQIFTYILGVLVCLVYVNMGATIDLTVVKEIAKKPIGPIVGIICQYGFMPVIAFGLAKLFFSDDSLMQLGLFLNGASPGGGSSNMWTLILGGSLDLSIMMTFASTIVAFAAVPIWVLSLGPQIVGTDSDFQIPYGQIAMIVVLLVIPCAAGVGMQKWSPKAAKFLETRVLKPFSIFMIVFIFTFGIYSYRYVFQMLNWKILLSCFGLPGLGYLSGCIMSIITRRNLADTIAISIETGVQNANIAIVILKVTLEAPSGDLAVVIPACCVLMTPIPLVFALIIKKIYGRFANSGGKDITAPGEEVPKQKTESISTISNGYVNPVVLPDMNPEQGNSPDNGFLSKRRSKFYGVDNKGADFTDDKV